MREKIAATRSRTVRKEDTASELDPTLPPAAATPFLLTLAELASHDSLKPELADDETSVGVSATIVHKAATPAGGSLTASATLVEREGKLRFTIVINDDFREVATVDHVRAVVKRAKLEERMAEDTQGLSDRVSKDAESTV